MFKVVLHCRIEIMTFGRYLVSSALICRVVSNFHLVAEVGTQLENTQKRSVEKADANNVCVL